uniref:Acid protease n=1 Tax=Mycena chlorophos TaxID=658473 RepID=A0ABQ0KUP4_MYCCL|nr:acid protease [Mycena chlorophos]
MAKTKTPKPKHNFDPYDEALVPDAMPFPALGRLLATKAGEVVVPKLNKHQRDFLLEQLSQKTGLTTLKGKAATEYYAELKNAAFDAKAFQHSVADAAAEAAEEATIPALVADWRASNPRYKGTTNADDGEELEEDEDARTHLIRGYTRAGWSAAMQKLISNKRTADVNRDKRGNVDGPSGRATVPGATDSPEADGTLPVINTTSTSIPDTALSSLFGIASFSGRDQFRQDHHDAILEHSKKVEGTMNAGAKFRVAEAELWKREDPEHWEKLANQTKGVDWNERHGLIPNAFKHFVEALNVGGKFRPFMAVMATCWLGPDGRLHFDWTEGVPSTITANESFESTHKPTFDAFLNSFHVWARTPLQDYFAMQQREDRAPIPVFPLSLEAVLDAPQKMLEEAVRAFIPHSYAAAFGDGDIPWVDIAANPDQFFDSERIPLRFDASGLDGLGRRDMFGIAEILATHAGTSSEGLFRKKAADKPSPSPPPKSPTPPPKSPTPPPKSPTPPPKSPSPPPKSPIKPSTRPPSPVLSEMSDAELLLPPPPVKPKAKTKAKSAAAKPKGKGPTSAPAPEPSPRKTRGQRGVPTHAGTFWELPSSQVFVNGQSNSDLTVNQTIIFDSGTSNVLFPTDFTNAIYALISPDIQPYSAEPGTYGIPCSSIPSLDAVISIGFTDESGVPFNLTIPSSELSVGPFAGNETICQTLINAYDGLSLVGGSLLKHYYRRVLCMGHWKPANGLRC